jgi:PAS domain S-box-containing protein
MTPTGFGDPGDAWTDENLFQALADASQDSIFLLSVTGAIRFLNGRARQALAGDAEIIGRPWQEIWPEAHRDEARRAMHEAHTGRPARFRAFLSAHDGTAARWLDTTLSPARSGSEVTGLIAIARDVTAEIETQSFLDNIVEYVPAALFAMDARDGRYLMLNLAAEEMMHLPREAVIGRRSADLFPRPVAAAIESRIAEVIAAGRVRVYEDRLPTPAGIQTLRVSMMATYGDEGARHIIGVTEDITEQKRAAAAMAEAAERAEAANRSKSEFLANMSHEIRTPLNGVVGVADVLARTELTAPQRDMVELIRSSGVTLERLLSDVLDLARIESGRLEIESEPFHLADAARSVAGLLTMRAQEKGVALNLELAPEADGRVVGDVVRLKQILTNLLSNAVKFTEKGEVRLTVSAPAEGGFRFDIRDTGVGFDARQKARVFARFQQADGSITRRFGGSGLGLAISLQLAELMGGTLDCESTPGEGSTFTLVLPLPAAEAEASVGAGHGPAAGVAAREEDRPMRVLLADDHPTNRKVVELILAQVGVELTSVENGLAAVEAFRRRAYDAVLMDMQMPVMDGLTATRLIRDHEEARGLAPTPVLMLTANALAEHLEASRRAGADAHLSKPITADKLLGTLAALEPSAEPETAAAWSECVA